MTRQLTLALSLASTLLGLPRTARAQDADLLFGRIQQLVNAGNRAGARALADSALSVRTQGTQAYAEALYARAYASSDAGAAERDYLRVSIEYPFSPRVEESIMRVAEFRQARGDRAGARAQFQRLALDYPAGEHTARAAYAAGRMALEDGDLTNGCTFLYLASERVPKADVEQRNRIEYLRNRCMMPAVAAPAPNDSAARADSIARAVRDSIAALPTVEYSVQVGQFQNKRNADALVARLKARGFQVRSVGARAPYRVRVGRYPSREDAVAAQRRMKASRVDGVVVEAEPR